MESTFKVGDRVHVKIYERLGTIVQPYMDIKEGYVAILIDGLKYFDYYDYDTVLESSIRHLTPLEKML